MPWGFQEVVQLAPLPPRLPQGSQPQGLWSVPTPVCSAAAVLHSFSPPALSAVTPWPSAHSCFSGLPSLIAPYSFPKECISVNLRQFNKYTLSYCVLKPEQGYRNEKKLVLAHRAEMSVIWWTFFQAGGRQGESLR